MNEMRVIVALPAATQALTRVSTEMFDDGSLGAVVEIHHPGGDQIALVSEHPDVFDRLSVVAASARDELWSAAAGRQRPTRFIPRPGVL
ncbi:hypothetical protein CLV30_102112 [Haloactinopolyspora alba]|uniref:Uncharacterized protein n=1 Tax=Haloactinopolyspora alba TaxID=648780 RepID=A0A2P8EB78_9ACTN|nr:hypothetical protein [Haloactinopolyspora alba]PSL06726.1 hypothetical protein CLV30_102112 [Haloactinopolyspora alba]